MPFTTREFFDLFATYNRAVWPAQLLLAGLAVGAVVLVVLRARSGPRVASGVLAALWLWMGTVYHLAFFTTINPAAWGFGAAFLAQALVFLWVGVRHDRLRYRAATTVDGVAGAALIAYALVVYPAIGYLSGHRYPAAPTFGVPCPTTIFTLGMLVWVSGPVPWSAVWIPVGWAAIGAVAAVGLGVAQDYGLPAAALIAVILLARRRRAPAAASHSIGPSAAR